MRWVLGASRPRSLALRIEIRTAASTDRGSPFAIAAPRQRRADQAFGFYKIRGLGPAAFRRRAFCDVAAGPAPDLPRFVHNPCSLGPSKQLVSDAQGFFPKIS